MGKVVKIKCPLCQDVESFKVGYDYTDSKYRLFDLKSDTSLLSKVESSKTKNKIETFIRHGADITPGYGYKLYICNKCYKVKSEYDFTLISYNDSYTVKHICKECNNPLEELDTSKLFQYKCPKCEKISLYFLNNFKK